MVGLSAWVLCLLAKDTSPGGAVARVLGAWTLGLLAKDTSPGGAVVRVLGESSSASSVRLVTLFSLRDTSPGGAVACRGLGVGAVP